MKQPIMKPSLLLYYHLIIKLIRCLFWAFMIEFVAHYFYLESLTYRPYLIIDKCDASVICHWSVVLCYGLRFYLHYRVRYGVAATISRFDWLSPPQEPRCIAHMGSYNEIKRYWLK